MGGGEPRPSLLAVDLSYIPGYRLAVGGGVWTAEAMAELARLDFTHVVNLQGEFDNRDLAVAAGLIALWNPTEDDLAAKPPEFFERSVQFARTALAWPGHQVYVHCAAGIHRGPITAAAILCGEGCELEEALRLVAACREQADFPEVYVASLRRWVDTQTRAAPRPRREAIK